MPWEIYQYFILNQPGLTTDHATHRRWAEVVMALERLGDAPIQEIQLLKTIGLLNIISAQGGLKASKEIIALCGDGNRDTINNALESLQEKSIITYRKYNAEYRVWQGSDFDLEASVQEQKAQMTSVHLAETLNEKKLLEQFQDAAKKPILFGFDHGVQGFISVVRHAFNSIDAFYKRLHLFVLFVAFHDADLFEYFDNWLLTLHRTLGVR